MLAVVYLITDRPDHGGPRQGAPLRDRLRDRLRRRPGADLARPPRRRSRTALVAAALARSLVVAAIALGYPVQRHYLNHRFANLTAETSIPGHGPRRRLPLGARGRRTRASASPAPRPGFAGYGFYGPDLSNRVVYLGEQGPHGAYNAIPTCAGFRAAVNDDDLDYLVTSPFLNFLHPSKPIASPEARWLRGSGGVRPLLPRRQGHGLEGDRPAEAHLRRGERPAARSPQHPRRPDRPSPSALRPRLVATSQASSAPMKGARAK